MSTLLVIDDEPSIRYAFGDVFHEPEVKLLTAGSAREGLEVIAQRRPDVVILDINLPDLSGLETFRRIQSIDARIPVVFITAYGTTETAIEAMKLGAYDYLLKPLEHDQLCDLVSRAFDISRLMRVPAVVGETAATPETSDVLVGQCAAMQNVYKAIGLVAPQDVTVLIQGESGTGKELVARAIYQHSRRSTGPFLAINCAAIPDTLLESELFGHEKGAFSGADRKRIGKFEQCSGGTLFLDEIGDMTPLTQTKILRVLQEQQFERVGGNETIQTHVRLIAASNQDLEQLVTAGHFRSDLYYRLCVFSLKLPALRERREDLPLLVRHFIRRFSRELGKEIQTVAPETLALLDQYAWPGNLRELQSVLKQALLQARGPVLLPDFLPAYLRSSKPGGKSSEPVSDAGANDHTPHRSVRQEWEQFVTDRLRSGSENLREESMALMERDLIARVLQHTHGNQSQAAKILGIDRGSLRTKIRSLGISIDRSVW